MTWVLDVDGRAMVDGNVVLRRWVQAPSSVGMGREDGRGCVGSA